MLSVLAPIQGIEILAEFINILSDFPSIDAVRNVEVFSGIRKCLSKAKRSDFDVLLSNLSQARIVKLGSSEVSRAEKKHYFNNNQSMIKLISSPR